MMANGWFTFAILVSRTRGAQRSTARDLELISGLYFSRMFRLVLP